MSGTRTVFPETVSAVTATNSADVALGTLRFEADKVYAYVYNTGGAQALVGNAVRVSGLSDISVTVTSTSQIHVAFGVVQSATLTTAAYGWVLKQGRNTFLADANSSFAIGQGLILATDGAFGCATSIAGGTSTTIQICNVVGCALSAVASAGSGLAYFRFL